MKRFQLGLGLIVAVINVMGLGTIRTLPPMAGNRTIAAEAGNRVIAAEIPSRQASLPPLIEREQFFTNSGIEGAQLSPDGRFLVFQKPLNGVINLWVKGIDDPMATARPVTAKVERPIFIYFWSLLLKKSITP